MPMGYIFVGQYYCVSIVAPLQDWMRVNVALQVLDVEPR